MQLTLEIIILLIGIEIIKIYILYRILVAAIKRGMLEHYFDIKRIEKYSEEGE